MPQNQQVAKARPWLAKSGLIAGVIILAGGAVWFFTQQKAERPDSISDIPFTAPESIQAPVEEVKGAADLPESRIVLADRAVTAIDDNGDNKYKYTFQLADFTGAKRFTFGEATDLTYEPIMLYGNDRLAIYSEVSADENRTLSFSGEIEKSALPPYRYSGVLVDPGNTIMAYAGSDDTQDGEVDSIVVRTLVDSNERTVKNDAFVDPDEQPYPTLVPLAFSSAKDELYVQGTLDSEDPAAAYTLFRVKISDLSVQTVFSQAVDETTGKFRRLVGVYPDLGYAVVEAFDGGAIDEMDTESTPVPLKLEKYLLVDSDKFETWVTRAGVGVPVMLGANPVSPDGRYVVLESADPEQAGVIIWNVSDGAFTRMTEQGSFLAWSPDSHYVLIENFDYKGEGSYILQSLEVETKRQYDIFSQDDTSEGTGLNKIGDHFTLYLGITS